jgi:hypothetical protein
MLYVEKEKKFGLQCNTLFVIYCYPHKANSIMAQELAASFWASKIKEIQSFDL